MEVGEEVTLRVIGKQQLQIELLQQNLRSAQSALQRYERHECAPCLKPCCRGTNGEASEGSQIEGGFSELELEQ